jgi:hypothetical protein
VVVGVAGGTVVRIGVDVDGISVDVDGIGIDVGETGVDAGIPSKLHPNSNKRITPFHQIFFMRSLSFIRTSSTILADDEQANRLRLAPCALHGEVLA